MPFCLLPNKKQQKKSNNAVAFLNLEMKWQQHTSAARLIREKFGLTQEQLALYLDVTVGLLKMVELGRRELPLEALLKINKLTLFAPPAPPLPDIAAPNASIEKEKRQLRLEKLRLERTLEQTQEKFISAANGLALAQAFL